MAYNVKIDVFEGPFDLLLHLVRVNEMDIYDISVSNITKQYLEYIQEMENLDLDVAGEFLVMAATLVNLKSRTLMPPPVEEEEEEEEVDEAFESIRDAQDLMRRLVEYRQFKELARTLSDKEDEELRRFYRNSVLPTLEEEGDESDELREDISLLFNAFARVLEYASGQHAHHVLEDEFSVEEKMAQIRSLLASTTRLSVASVFKRCVNKQEIITVFLALLEICRLRQAQVRQKANFAEIYLVPPDEDDDDEED